jgi:hypothetical protein
LAPAQPCRHPTHMACTTALPPRGGESFTMNIATGLLAAATVTNAGPSRSPARSHRRASAPTCSRR